MKTELPDNYVIKPLFILFKLYWKDWFLKVCESEDQAIEFAKWHFENCLDGRQREDKKR